MNPIDKKRNEQLAHDIQAAFDIDENIFDAIASIDRAMFIPKGLTQHAYKLDALPIGGNQFISSPLTVAKMSQYLFLHNVDSVLEIGCGSGYQAAILSKLVRRVCTIERVEPLLREANQRFRALNIHNVLTRTADGQKGWSQYAPFERILFSAAATHIPDAIKDQLVDGGIIIAPIQVANTQIITRFVKEGDTLSSEEIEVCDFVPVLDGIQK